MAASQVPAWLSRLATRARAKGLEKRIHAHGFRHSHADQLRRRGWDMAMIQSQLGHSSLATTSVYLAHVSGGDLAERMRGESWGL